MSETSNPTPEQARELIDTLLEEEAGELLKLVTQLTETALENGNVTIAQAFFVYQHGRVDLTPTGRMFAQMDRWDLIQIAGRILLGALTCQIEERLMAGEGSQLDQQDKSKVN